MGTWNRQVLLNLSDNFQSCQNKKSRKIKYNLLCIIRLLPILKRHSVYTNFSPATVQFCHYILNIYTVFEADRSCFISVHFSSKIFQSYTVCTMVFVNLRSDTQKQYRFVKRSIVRKQLVLKTTSGETYLEKNPL